MIEGDFKTGRKPGVRVGGGITPPPGATLV